MVVSAAFDELTEVLQCLESSDAEVKNVEIGEQMVDETDEITADLTVGLPVLTGVELRDEVSIEAGNFDLRDERIDVELSVSIPVGGGHPERGSRPSVMGSSRSPNGSNSVPSYKDPEALAAVYERYDTFPEMTEALGADVTSETVRRYMVEYDIHDPSDSGPEAHRYAASSAATDSESETAVSASDADGSDDSSAGELKRGETADTEREPTRSNRSAETDDGSTDDGPSNEADGAGATDGADDAARAGREAGDSDTDDSDLGDTSVAELIAANDSEDAEDSLVADGLGIPKGLTVAELAAIVNGSNTLHEAKERLGISQDHARRLLRELNLIDLVTRRLGADQINVSPAEIRRRIDLDGSDSVR